MSRALILIFLHCDFIQFLDAFVRKWGQVISHLHGNFDRFGVFPEKITGASSDVLQCHLYGDNLGRGNIVGSLDV
jgi:hypothetical protein